MTVKLSPNTTESIQNTHKYPLISFKDYKEGIWGAEVFGKIRIADEWVLKRISHGKVFRNQIESIIETKLRVINSFIEGSSSDWKLDQHDERIHEILFLSIKILHDIRKICGDNNKYISFVGEFPDMIAQLTFHFLCYSKKELLSELIQEAFKTNLFSFVLKVTLGLDIPRPDTSHWISPTDLNIQSKKKIASVQSVKEKLKSKKSSSLKVSQRLSILMDKEQKKLDFTFKQTLGFGRIRRGRTLGIIPPNRGKHSSVGLTSAIKRDNSELNEASNPVFEGFRMKKIDVNIGGSPPMNLIFKKTLFSTKLDSKINRSLKFVHSSEAEIDTRAQMKFIRQLALILTAEEIDLIERGTLHQLFQASEKKRTIIFQNYVQSLDTVKY